MLFVIDAHQHFWRIDKHDCRWPTPDLTEIYRDFLPKDLVPIAEQAGISGSVLVQSQESDADTDFLLQLADESSLIKAVVGWVDLSSPNACERIHQLAQHPKFRGIRPMLQSLPDDAWILNPLLEPAIEVVKANNLSFDALVHVRHLPYLHIFAKRHPTLALVIDHAAKPDIAGGDFAFWASSIEFMADLPHVYCKLSGLLTESSAGQGIDELKPFVVDLYKRFGAQRLMWGSDWPVLHLAPNFRYANYSQWLLLAQRLLPMASDSERDAIFGGTARNFYHF
jgi:L-fuconolactonase